MRYFIVLVTLGWVQGLTQAQDNVERSLPEMHRLHQDPKAYIAMLDDPARDAYQRPHEVLTALIPCLALQAL